ncbi:twin-arginine translocase subunit TatC [Candidatus Roizmanbacteria bacterium]|nr:twin-arginine translocase subunit TatC [Candidatus Roizmanbacteria bacterium]
MKKDTLPLQAAITQYMPYLIEIRKRLLFIVAFFLIGASVGFIFFEPIIKAVMKFYNLKGLNIVFTSPFQFINISINSAITIGIMTAFPLIIYQLISFLKPALREQEYKLLLSSIPASLFLFIAGFGFGSWMMKFVVSIFSRQSSSLNVQNLWDIENFLQNIFMTSLFMGILFQFPVIMTPLIRLKVIKYQTLVDSRLTIYLALLILTVLMPATDIVSDALIFFPLAFLFEITLLLNRKYR